MRTKHCFAMTASLMLFAALAAGCRDHMPHRFLGWPYGGDMHRSYAKPPGFDNWDPYAATIEVTPVEDVNPVRTQHLLVATVRDKDGKPLPNRRVEWMLNEGGVGDIVEVDSNGWRASRGYKVDNHFAVSHTRSSPGKLTMGTQDPSDDVIIATGQTWLVITSPVEGETHITAYAPGIYDWNQHKAFAVKRWYDVNWEFPPPDTNPFNTPHEFVTKVTRYSDGAPLANYEVTYTIMDGPAGATFGGQRTAMVLTDSNGEARVTMNYGGPEEGTNNVKIDIMRPANEPCCLPAVPIASGMSSKTWLGPKIAITKDCVAQRNVDEPFEYTIVVSNPSQVPATGVTVSDSIPDGISLISTNPQAAVSGNNVTWSLGTVEGGQSVTVTASVKGTRKGTFKNCADVRTAEGLTASDCCETVIAQPAISIEKVCTPDVLLCDTIEHVITVRNTGDSPATNVRVTDELPDGMTTTSGQTSLTFDGGTIAPGEAKQAKFQAKVTRTGSFTNRARATADGGLMAESSCTTTVRKPELSVSKTASRDVQFIGRDLTFDITVANRGDGPARDTVVTDMLPAGTQFVSATDGGAMGGGGVSWSLGTLEAGASKTVQLTVKVNTAGQMKNVVNARAYCAEATAEIPFSAQGIPAVLLEVVDDPDPIELGSNVVYTIEVTNQGSADGTNIRVTAVIQPEGEYVSAEGATRGTVSGNTVTFEPLPVLAPKAKATFRVTVKAKTEGDVRFRVKMITDQTSSDVEESESTRFY